MSDKVYEIITEQLIKKMEQGTVPWKRAWFGGTGFPKNAVSKKPYNGANVFILWAQGFESEYWLTYKQAQDLGGNVKKGEKSTSVVFWKFSDVVKSDGTKDKVPFIRYYSVFNYEQCKDLPEIKERPLLDHDPIMEAERILLAMPNAPKTEFGKSRACYWPALDTVHMPSIGQFTLPDYYYETYFHELGHSTGHKSRLDRKQAFGHGFGSASYSKEELVAEMTAAFLCTITGIQEQVIDNCAAYLASWMQVLKENPRYLVQAASQAQKAADYIQGKKTNKDGE